MKKFYLCFLLLFSSLNAEIVDGTMVTGDNRAYFVLSDGTFWKVFSFVKRWRGPLEWFRGDDLGVPENYLCPVEQWLSGSEVEIYSKSRTQVDDSNASNQDDLKQATHLIINKHTNHILFAIAITPNHCLSEVFIQGKEAGYVQGYGKGKMEGNAEGYDKGVIAGKELNKNHGFREGFKQGQDSGYHEGFKEGKEYGRRVAIDPPPPYAPPR